jgi:adenosylcobalamin-dependent ribonucleoside-diphosphate reductase
MTQRNSNYLPLKLTKNAIKVLEARYLKKVEGKIVETPEDLFYRVADAMANVDERYGASAEEIEALRVKFYNMMVEGKFMPNSPALMNAGKNNGNSFSACIHGDSPVLTNSGYVPMREIYDRVNSGETVIVSNGFNEWVPVLAAINQGIKPVYRINTRAGRYVDCTLDHKFYTFEPGNRDNGAYETGSFKWAPIGEIPCGRRLAYGMQSPIVEDNNEIDSEIALAAWILTDGGCGWYKQSKGTTGEFFVGEIQVIDDRSLDNVINHINKLGFSYTQKDISGVGGVERFTRIRSYDRKLAKFCEKFELFNRTNTKIVSSLIRNSSYSNKREFLRIVFEADGCITGTGIGFQSVSQVLVENISEMLDLFGIAHTINFKKERRVGRLDGWSIQINHTRSILLFKERIGFISDRKQLKLSQWPEKNPYPENIKYVGNEYLGEDEVFDIQTAIDGNGSFVVDGIIVHNCFVLPLNDSIRDIFTTALNTALVQKAGGGTGFSFDKLRPTGDFINSSGGTTSGPISFWKVLAETTNSIQQGCFVGSTLIGMPGQNKQIRDIKKGDVVYSYDTNIGHVVYKKAACDAFKTKENAPVFKLSTNRGLDVFVTENHQFLLRSNDYIELKDLDSRLPIMSLLRRLDVSQVDATYPAQTTDGIDYSFVSNNYLDSVYDTVVASIEFSHHEDVWDFEVEDTHNFSVVGNDGEGIFVHNSMRRGANMGMMTITHPDILKFITAKQDLSKFTNYNISIKIPDAWMVEYKKCPDAPHVAINFRTGDRYVIPKTVPIETYEINELIRYEDYVEGSVKIWTMREIFGIIIDCAWKTGEPGLFFIDKVNEKNATPHVGEIEASNPCGELPLLPYEACNLGSLNIAAFVTENGLDWESLGQYIRTATYFLDTVIDASPFPIPEIKKMCDENRKIGLGLMGFADAMFLLGISYNSDEGIEFGRKLMKFINDTALDESESIAKKKGVFPNYVGSRWETEWNRTLRNAGVTTVAPTGTISIIADCSGGIEPMFSLAFERNVLNGQKLIEVNKIFEKVAKDRGFYSPELMERLAKEGTLQHIDEVPDDIKKIYVCSHDIAPEWHIRMQAAFQESCSSSISKTINMPHTASREDVEQTYLMAWEMNCKGITVYRDGCRDMQPMSLKKESAKMEIPEAKEEAKHIEEQQIELQNIFVGVPEGQIISDVSFPDRSHSETYVIRAGKKGSKTHKKIYTTLAFADKDLTRPFAMFVNSNSFTSNEVTDEIVKILKALAKEKLSEDAIHALRESMKGQSKISQLIHITSAVATVGVTAQDIIAVLPHENKTDEDPVVTADIISILTKLAAEKGIRKELVEDLEKKYRNQVNVVKIARLIGMLLRHNVRISDVVESFDQVQFPVTSFVFQIKKLLSKFIKDGTEVTGKTGCPECGGKMVYQEGCLKCASGCGWSKCK